MRVGIQQLMINKIMDPKFVSSQNSYVDSLTPNNGIWRWGLWEVIQLWRQGLWSYGLFQCPYEKDSRNDLSQYADVARRQPSCKRALIRNGIRWHLNFVLSITQNNKN
jgi:hypothetical protein